MMKNYIVIPTYKEVDNLRELLPILTRYNVIIVDDNSLDGTEKLCKKYKNVKLIVRKGKRGLASAVIDGVLSIKEKDAKVVVMDADFQHDPKKLPDFFNALDKNGFVCGARNRLNMPFYRKIISKTAKGLAKILVPETNAVSDPMSGYFGFRLNAVNLDKVKPIGYKIMLEFIVNLKPNESIKEVKYDFRERKFGSSKLGFKVIIDYIKQVLRLNNYRVLIFALVGLSGVLVNEGIAFLLHPYLPLYLVFLVSAESSVLTNFMLNHNFTFHRRVKFTKALPRYNLIALAGLLINVGVALYLSMFIEYLLANFFGILIAFIFNYSLSETVAWSNITNYHEKTKSHSRFDIKTIGKYYSIFSDFIYKNRKWVILSLFIALSVFFSLEFYYIRIWDYLVRIMDAQFFFHGGTYFEIPRAILESVIIGLYGFVMGPLAIYGFIITATVIFFLAVYDFSKAFKLKMLLVLLILMNPYIIFYTMQAGSELMVFSFLILFVAEVKRGRAFYAGLFFVLAFISKYYAIFFIILALFLINKDIRKSLEKILVFIGSSLLFISPYLAYNLIFFHNFIYSFASSVKENAGGGLIPALPSNFLYLMLEFAFLAAVIAIVVIRSLLFKTKERTHWLSFKNNGLMLLVVAFLIGAYIFGTSAHSLGGGYRFILGAVIFSTLIVSLALNKRDTGWMFALAVIGIIFAIFILMSFADDGHINKVEMQTAISLFKSVYNTTNCTVQSNQWVELNYYGLSATYPLYNASASTQYPILNFGPVNTTYPLIKEEDNFYLYGYSTCKYTPPIKLPGYFYYRINQSRSNPSLACSYLSERTFNFVGQACNDVNNLFLKLIN